MPRRAKLSAAALHKCSLHPQDAHSFVVINTIFFISLWPDQVHELSNPFSDESATVRQLYADGGQHRGRDPPQRMRVDGQGVPQDSQSASEWHVPAGHSGNPNPGEPLSHCLLRSICWRYLAEHPTDHMQVFRRRKSKSVAFFSDGRVMGSMIVERLAEICHSARESHRSPYFPVAAETQTFVRAADSLVDGLPEQDAAGIANGIDAYEVLTALFATVDVKVLCPLFRIHNLKVGVSIPVHLSVSIDAPGAAINKYDLPVGVEDSH